MSPRRRPGRKLFKALFPIVLLLVLAVVGLVSWIIYGATHPPQSSYLVTPERFALLSDRGLKATEETWTNRDGTQSRGWLLRGAQGAPAVVMLHGYGANRSWYLNLGVKLNEATNFTVLWPDLRGHGETPDIKWTTFGAREAEDALAAVDYLRGLKSADGQPLVGQAVGLYGVEMGAYAALLAATSDATIQALALDSVPASPADMLRTTVTNRTGLDNSALQSLVRTGTGIYLGGNFQTPPACEVAARLANRKVLLLAGSDAEHLRDSTSALVQCFPPTANVELKNDLTLTGLNLPSAPGAQGEQYDRRIIDFFDRTLR